jgi:hypothetical protein
MERLCHRPHRHAADEKDADEFVELLAPLWQVREMTMQYAKSSQ